MSMVYTLSNSLSAYISILTDWAGTSAPLLAGIIYLLIGSVALKFSPKAQEVASKIRNAFYGNINEDEDEITYCDISNITLSDLEKIGEINNCKIKKDDKNIILTCPKNLEDQSLSNIPQIIAFVFINAIVILPTFLIKFYLLDSYKGSISWFILLLLSSLIMFESIFIKLYEIIIIFDFHVLFAYSLFPQILDIIPFAFPMAIIFTGITILLYLFQYQNCKINNSWWCDRL